MSPPKPRSNSLKDLQEFWYEKLKDDGFKDIEDNKERLKTHSMYFSIQFGRDRFEAIQEYYIMAGRFLNTHKFASRYEKSVWKYHSEGMSIEAIIRAFKKKGGSTFKDKVQKTINRLADEMLKDVSIKK